MTRPSGANTAPSSRMGVRYRPADVGAATDEPIAGIAATRATNVASASFRISPPAGRPVWTWTRVRNADTPDLSGRYPAKRSCQLMVASEQVADRHFTSDKS